MEKFCTSAIHGISNRIEIGSLHESRVRPQLALAPSLVSLQSTDFHINRFSKKPHKLSTDARPSNDAEWSLPGPRNFPHPKTSGREAVELAKRILSLEMETKSVSIVRLSKRARVETRHQHHQAPVATTRRTPPSRLLYDCTSKRCSSSKEGFHIK
jgi:hypothetical protein